LSSDDAPVAAAPIALPDATTATAVFGEAVAIPGAVAAQIAAACPTSTDPGSLAEHGRDWWPLGIHWALSNRTPQLAGLVCRPTSTAEVSAVLGICSRNGLPVTASGGRSSVTGAAVPLRGGVVLDMCAMRGLVSVDTVSGVVEVLAGTFGPELESTLRAGHAMSVGHFPQSFDISTVGGWVASRGAGQYSTRYGKIEDMVTALEVVLADGTVVRTGGAPAAAAGPDLTQLFLGSEGTLGVVTRVWLRAHDLATHEIRSAHSFDSFSVGIEACRRIIRGGTTPAVLRLYDEQESRRSHGGDGSRAVLLVLDEGDDAGTRAVSAAVREVASALDARPETDDLVEKWLGHRNDTSGLQALISRGYVVDTMEVAAPWSRLEAVHRAVVDALLGVDHARAATCHLSHSYPDGACLYFTFAAQPPADNYDEVYRALWNAGQRAALGAGANLSHHHGVGLNRAPYAQEALGESLAVLRAIKHALDPTGILNPGKMALGSAGERDAR